MKILIAEDGFVPRKLLIQQLTPLGEVDIASNGEEAVTAVKMALDEDSHYKLILLDIKMPVVDGLQALKKIREIESQQGLDQKSMSKIIMITAHSDKENVIAAARRRCDAYLIKPVTQPRLFEEIRKLGLDISESYQE